MGDKRLRTSLFGYRRKDVIDYINNLDLNAQKMIKEKTDENKQLKDEIDGMRHELEDARKNRDAIVSVLEIAQKKADEILTGARAAAKQIEEDAAKYAEDEKNNVNREIEVKRREIDNQLVGESKKIASLRKEIEDLRQASLKSIKRFEQELGNIESLLNQKEKNAAEEAESASEKKKGSFFDAIRTVPIKIVKSSAEK